MKLFLKQDTSADDRCFTVYDEFGEEKYHARLAASKLISGQRVSITDTGGEEKARIRRLPLVGTNAYVLKFHRKHVTFVTLPTPTGFRSFFYGSNLLVNGEVLTKNFSIIDVDKTLILEHRRYADYCELLIPDSRSELFCVAASVCVNLINTIETPAFQAV